MTCANKNMSPSQRENLSTEDAASVNGDRGVVAKSGGLDKSDFNLQLFPCKGQSGGNPRLVYQELSKITHKLVAVVAVLCFLVVGLLLSNIHLQMRVREFEEMVIRMRPELVLHPQKSPATEAGQEATFPARGGQHHVNPPMAGRITLWSGQSGRRKRSAQICPTFSVREMVNEYCKAKKGIRSD
ncbi:unnamed protein product [Lymnaea stagnalis]|uniref:Uncharacterized protein n=1 Tax=Lymnaea stagnalis TaxID=6523 RepID=A0AAV2H9N9_LYMST